MPTSPWLAQHSTATTVQSRTPIAAASPARLSTPAVGRRRPGREHRGGVRLVLLVLLGLDTTLGACGRQKDLPLYEAVPVSRRDLVVSAVAAGQLEPVLTVDVKSKASGEIIDMRVETGADVQPAQLLASIDRRLPRNPPAQA